VQRRRELEEALFRRRHGGSKDDDDDDDDEAQRRPVERRAERPQLEVEKPPERPPAPIGERLHCFLQCATA
jgi:hypothetical protein